MVQNEKHAEKARFHAYQDPVEFPPRDRGRHV